MFFSPLEKLRDQGWVHLKAGRFSAGNAQMGPLKNGGFGAPVVTVFGVPRQLISPNITLRYLGFTSVLGLYVFGF